MELRVATLDDAAAVAAVYRPYRLDADLARKSTSGRGRDATAHSSHAHRVLARLRPARRVVGTPVAANTDRAPPIDGPSTARSTSTSFHRRGVGRPVRRCSALAAQRVSLYAGVTLPNQAV